MPDVTISWGKDGKRRLYYCGKEIVIGTVSINKNDKNTS